MISKIQVFTYFQIQDRSAWTLPAKKKPTQTADSKKCTFFSLLLSLSLSHSVISDKSRWIEKSFGSIKTFTWLVNEWTITRLGSRRFVTKVVFCFSQKKSDDADEIRLINHFSSNNELFSFVISAFHRHNECDECTDKT